MFLEGDAANEFYFIRKGLVSVEIMVQNSGPKEVHTVGGGEILGWSWVSPPYHWHFNARTLKPTRALVFDANCLRAKCEQDYDLGYEMLKRFSNIITARLDATRTQLLNIYTNRTEHYPGSPRHKVQRSPPRPHHQSGYLKGSRFVLVMIDIQAGSSALP